MSLSAKKVLEWILKFLKNKKQIKIEIDKKEAKIALNK